MQQTEALIKANQDYIQAVARADISDTDRLRLMKQSTQITGANAQGVVTRDEISAGSRYSPTWGGSSYSRKSLDTLY